MSKENYYVIVTRYKTKEVVEMLGPMPKRKAEKCAAGMEINLDHDEYYVSVVEK